MRRSFSDARIVVVDDDEAIRGLLQAMLSLSGYSNVELVEDPRTVIDLVATGQPDLIILDLHMPTIDGFEVMERLQPLLADGSYLPILVVTADITTEARRRALAGGAHDFIEKPFDVTELRLRIANLLETRFLHVELERHNQALERRLRDETETRRDHEEALQRKRERIDATIDAGLVSVVFQPIVALATGALVGVEALARFPDEPARPPDRWFREAAEVGRATELEVCAIGEALQKFRGVPAGVYLSVNVSPDVAGEVAWRDLVGDLPVDRLVIELTEHEAVRDYAALQRSLRSLRQAGARIAVDDTGAGFAGLNHLLGLRPDIIKLDRQLVTGIHTQPTQRALAAALVLFAGDIGATVTAEGVEQADEARALRDLGVHCGQGFFFAPPQLPEVIDLRDIATVPT